MLVEVVLRTLSRTLDQVFTYCLPSDMQRVQVGDRVVVPFGGGDRYMEGVVWQLVDTQPDYPLKPIAAVLDGRYRMSRSQMLLLQGIRRLYGATYSQSLQCVLPNLQQLVVETHYRILTEGFGPIHSVVPEDQLLQRFTKAKLKRAVSSGELEKVAQFTFKVVEKVSEVVTYGDKPLSEALLEISNRQKVAQRILVHLEGVGSCELRALASAANATRKHVMALVDQGLISYKVEAVHADPLQHSLSPTMHGANTSSKLPLQPLTPNQVAVVARFQEHPRALLEGITGSGKTRVYLELAQNILQGGQQVLVLVPEIALTPQLVSRFSQYLEGDIAVLHSHVSARDKVNYYHRIARGDVAIVIGARSALFAPFKNLGLIVVDEEHETSYRSDVQPQYDARELVSLLGQALPTQVLFGSASPSAQRVAMTMDGRLGYLQLKDRIGKAVLPDVSVVDLRMSNLLGPLLSEYLLEGILKTLARGEQVILLHNRKGYARYSQCSACGHVEKCVNCDIPLTVYQQGSKLSCHYCSYQRPAETQCRVCGGPLIHKGLGLEQVWEGLVAALPGVSIKALDGDSVSKPEVFTQTLQAFQDGKIQVLLGTQLLAKGLDFPKVTFVGVLLADQMLNLPDYGAPERAMQLLLQVSGRAGRAELPGRVIIQTYQPEHPVIQQVLNHDYAGFLSRELALRAALNYPPYGQLYSIRILGDDLGITGRQAEDIYRFYEDNFKRHGLAVQIFPPNTAYYGRIKNKYAFQIILKATTDLHYKLIKLMYNGLVKNQYKLIQSDCHIDFSVNPTF